MSKKNTSASLTTSEASWKRLSTAAFSSRMRTLLLAWRSEMLTAWPTVSRSQAKKLVSPAAARPLPAGAARVDQLLGLQLVCAAAAAAVVQAGPGRHALQRRARCMLV